MSENIAIITFFDGWEPGGVGSDGLPLFHEVVKIRKSVPPLTEVTYVATEADFEEFQQPYQRFLKERGARKPAGDGYPLAMWPVIGPADFQTLVARDILTVQQLAVLAGKRNPTDIPAPVMELAKRAKRFVELQQSSGKFEAIIAQLTAERDQLAAELKEANATISAQNAMLTKAKAA